MSDCCDNSAVYIFPGDDVLFVFTVEDTDLTGTKVYLTIKRDGDSDPVVDLDTDSHTDPTGGISTITVPKATTITMEPGAPYTGTFRMKSAGGIVTTPGNFTVVVERPVSTRSD